MAVLFYYRSYCLRCFSLWVRIINRGRQRCGGTRELGENICVCFDVLNKKLVRYKFGLPLCDTWVLITVISWLRWDQSVFCYGRSEANSVTLPSSLSSSASTPVLSVNSFTLTAGRGCVVVKSPWVPQLKDTTQVTPEVSFHDSTTAHTMTSSPTISESLFYSSVKAEVWREREISTFSNWGKSQKMMSDKLFSNQVKNKSMFCESLHSHFNWVWK